MATDFLRTVRALDDHSRGTQGVALALLTLFGAAWLLWFTAARVSVWEVANQGRLEVSGAVHPLQTVESGAVRSTRLALGARVRKGQVVVELDAREQELARAEAVARQHACSSGIEALQHEIANLSRAHADELLVADAALENGRATRDEVNARLRLALDEARRTRQLRSEGHVPEQQLVRAQGEVEALQAAVLAQSSAVTRLASERKAKASEQRVALDTLARQITVLEGERNALEASVRRLDAVIERHLVRAPVDGRLDELGALRPGSVVSSGQRLASLVPAGELRIIAHFPADTSVGRVRIGQRAQVRLTGFAWLEYGALDATVTHVGTEAQIDGVRIELRLLERPDTRVPLQHGLVGTVEVEVERTSPLALLLRGLGRRLAPANAVARQPEPQ